MGSRSPADQLDPNRRLSRLARGGGVGVVNLHEVSGSLSGLRALVSETTHRRLPPPDTRNHRSNGNVQGNRHHQPIYAEVEAGILREVAPLPPPPAILDRRTNSTVVTAAAWNYRRGGCSVIERGDRIKPERSHRRTVQKLTWRESQWVKSFPDSDLLDSRVSSMTIADVSPAVAIRRVLLLYEKGQYREAANFITRLNHSTFKAILGDLPLDLFVDSIPHGLPVLEALYAKVFLSDDLNFSVKLLRPDNVIMQMVRMFAQHEEPCPTGSVRGEIGVVASTLKPVMPSCKKLLKVIVLTEPRTKKQLGGKKRSLDKALEGMGRHGLVGTTDDTLMNLHEALKVEFERAMHQFKTAVQKLDDLSLASKQPVTRSVSYGPAPTDASHQRQLSLRQDEIQERLIKNKTLLNLIEPTLTNHSLEILLQILRKRVEFDKDVLFQFTQLRKEVKDVNPNSIVAPVLMRFSHGCLQVLDLMKEVADDEDDDSSDISGYHSDSDSAIALSGSSQYNGLAARRNHLLYRSARVTSSSSGGSRSGGSSPDARSLEEKSDRSHRLKFKKPNNSGNGTTTTTTTTRCAKPFANGTTSPDPWEVNQLKKDLEMAREELRRTRVVMADLQDRERKMKDRLAEQAQKMLERGVRFENVSMGERRPTALIRKYGNLYAQARVDTLDALDALDELRDGDELKSKLLFSVVVLAFRSVQANLLEIKGGIKRALQIPDSTTSVAELPPSARELESSVNSFLRDTIERFDIRKCVEEVCSQIWATLYDYPCLKGCDGLIQYVRDCVRLAWGLANQHPPFVIEYETRTFRRDMHVRFHASNQDSAEIKTYLWPALLEGQEGPCVHKGVVVT